MLVNLEPNGDVDSALKRLGALKRESRWCATAVEQFSSNRSYSPRSIPPALGPVRATLQRDVR